MKTTRRTYRGAIKIIVLAFCLACRSKATTILSASQTFTEAPDHFQLLETYDVDFTLTIFGETGSAFFLPRFFLQGEDTQTSPCCQTATAYVSGPVNLRIDWAQGPTARCTPFNCPYIPFTFSLPQDFHIVASVLIVYNYLDLGTPFVPTTLSASVDFDGIGPVVPFPGSFSYIDNITYTLDPVDTAPEPQGIFLSILGVALIGFRKIALNRRKVC